MGESFGSNKFGILLSPCFLLPMRIQLPYRTPHTPAIRLESFLVLLGLSLAMAVLALGFLRINNFLNILLATAVIGVLAIAATFVLSSAGLDL